VDKWIGWLHKRCESLYLSLELCAERGNEGLALGCANRSDWEYLELSMEPLQRKQRAECYCDVAKHDLLKGKKDCGHRCLYCYWSKYRWD